MTHLSEFQSGVLAEISPGTSPVHVGNFTASADTLIVIEHLGDKRKHAKRLEMCEVLMTVMK